MTPKLIFFVLISESMKFTIMNSILTYDTLYVVPDRVLGLWLNSCTKFMIIRKRYLVYLLYFWKMVGIYKNWSRRDNMVDMVSLSCNQYQSENQNHPSWYVCTIYITLFEIFIFCPKIQLKFIDFFWVKNSWKCCGFGLFSCWQIDLTKKIVQKKLGEKLVKLNFWTKIWLFE